MISGHSRLTIDQDNDGKEETFEDRETDPKGYMEFFL